MTLGKQKKDIPVKRDIEVYCHENFSDYLTRRILDEVHIRKYLGLEKLSQVKYRDYEETAPALVTHCAIAPYIDLFNSVSSGLNLKKIPEADKAAFELEQESFFEVLKEIAQGSYQFYPQRVIPVCRYANEELTKKIIGQIEYAKYHPNSGWQKNDNKIAADLAAEALLLNDTEAAKAFAQSTGRIKEYEKIHK